MPLYFIARIIDALLFDKIATLSLFILILFGTLSASSNTHPEKELPFRSLSIPPTRFFPLSTAIRQHIQDSLIGEVLRVYADNSTGVDISKLGPTHRYLGKGLAGGALLDIGIYPFIWVFQILHHIDAVSS